MPDLLCEPNTWIPVYLDIKVGIPGYLDKCVYLGTRMAVSLCAGAPLTDSSNSNSPLKLNLFVEVVCVFVCV